MGRMQACRLCYVCLAASASTGPSAIVDAYSSGPVSDLAKLLAIAWTSCVPDQHVAIKVSFDAALQGSAPAR